MAKNKNLNSAAKAKKDKFYTQLDDIAEEVRHYMDFLKGKVVLCNCDDPVESNFFQYFALMFNALELKKLIATSYADSPIAGKEINLFPDGKTAYKIEMNELKDWNGDTGEDWNDIELGLREGMIKTTQLEGDEKYCAGDFRSKECIELLKEADVVVTNPPFSVFREYVAQLIEYHKKFLIIGNVNAITYKEIFPLIMQNKIWLGYGFRGMVGFFESPYEDFASASEHHEGMIRNSGVHWYTNIETKKRFWDITLYKKYSPEKNPRYDNYDAIEVSKTGEIPEDYFGVMGVPITFLEYYDSRQFEIVGLDRYTVPKKFLVGGRVAINGKPCYARILIRRRQQ